MDTKNIQFDILQYRLKSARRKRRLQKQDFDKQLIQLIKKRDKLWQQQQDLPIVPIENPYQSGWVRYFVLTEKLQLAKNAAFYQALLDKINTWQYHSEQSFRKKKKKKRRKEPEERKQFLNSFTLYYWNHAKCPLNEEERTHFHLHEEQLNNTSTFRYLFNEPWRFVLRIKPYIVTHKKMLDEQLEQEIKLLHNHIKNHDLVPRINKLNGGIRRHYGWFEGMRPGYRNPMQNKAFPAFLEEYHYKTIQEF